MSGLTSPLSEAAVVVGEAEESEEEEDLEAKEDSKSIESKAKEDSKRSESKADSPQRDEETKSTRLGDARASLAGLRLSSVTATVERTLGSLPSIELPHWAPATSNKSPTGKEEEPQYPSLLHKRLHERNGEIRADLHFFFQELFRKNEDQLEDVCQSTQSSVELLQETVQCLQRSHHQASLLGERLEILDNSLNSSGLPPSPVIEETKD